MHSVKPSQLPKSTNQIVLKKYDNFEKNALKLRDSDPFMMKTATQKKSKQPVCGYPKETLENVRNNTTKHRKVRLPTVQ